MSDESTKETVPIVVPDIVGRILDRTEAVQKSIDHLSTRTGERLSNIESISRRNADALMEVKSDLKNHRNDISGLRAKVVELDIRDKTCPAKDAIGRFERMFDRLDEAQSEDSKIIRIIEGKIEDYKNIKRVTGSGPPFKGFWKQHGWPIVSAIAISFVVGIGATAIIFWQWAGLSGPKPAVQETETRQAEPRMERKGWEHRDKSEDTSLGSGTDR